jgi:hypothetical protein
VIYFELLPLTLNAENEKIGEAKTQNCITLRDTKYLAHESYRCIKYFVLKLFIYPWFINGVIKTSHYTARTKIRPT